MELIDIIKGNKPYTLVESGNGAKLQQKSKRLCWEYNMTSPDDSEKKSEILSELLGTYNPQVFIEPSFRCDYGFNIHFHGFALVNYNCVILDTSPVHIGKNAFIAPGVCIACAGHGILPAQRAEGVSTSAPIIIEDDVWIGANATVIGGVTIGAGSIIGAGSVVVRDIPRGVIAVGNPARVLRKITDKDRLELTKL